jgi:hypothetical protein
MSAPSLAIDQLRSSWHGLHDLGRALAVKSINQLGVRLVELAFVLNCSPNDLHCLHRMGIRPLGLGQEARCPSPRKCTQTFRRDRGRTTILILSEF